MKNSKIEGIIRYLEAQQQIDFTRTGAARKWFELDMACALISRVTGVWSFHPGGAVGLVKRLGMSA